MPVFSGEPVLGHPVDIGKYRMGTKFKMANICVNLIIWKNAECPIKDLKKLLI
jgi:hypothetical protein